MQMAVLPFLIVSASQSGFLFIIFVKKGEFGLKQSSTAFVTAWRSNEIQILDYDDHECTYIHPIGIIANCCH